METTTGTGIEQPELEELDRDGCFVRLLNLTNQYVVGQLELRPFRDQARGYFKRGGFQPQDLGFLVWAAIETGRALMDENLATEEGLKQLLEQTLQHVHGEMWGRSGE